MDATSMQRRPVVPKVLLTIEQAAEAMDVGPRCSPGWRQRRRAGSTGWARRSCSRLAVIDAGRGRAAERAQVIRHRLHMLLGIWAARGVLSLETAPLDSVAVLYWRHADELERLDEEVGGAASLFQKHYQRTFKVAAPRDLFAVN